MDPEVIETEETVPSLRETLEEAIEEHDPQHELVPESTSAPEPTTPTSPPVEGAATPEPGPPDAASNATAATETPLTQPQAAVPPVELKAPAQWRKPAQDTWNSLPRAAQEEIHKREADTMRLIGSVGPKIRMADEVSAHMAPFAERLAQNGVGPSAFIGDVFSSIKTLASGDPMQRAEVVANIVQSYGVDVRALDAILTRRMNLPPEVHQAREMMARATAMTQQHNAGIEQQSAATAEKALAAFAGDPKHEFFEQVRSLMADLIDTGRAKTLEDAYSAAVWANTDTRKILLDREAQTRANGKTKRAQTARRASASVHGTPSIPAPAVPGTNNQSLRDALTDAFDEHSPL